MVDERRLGKTGGIVNLGHGAVLVEHAVGHVGDGCNHVHVEFPAEPLLDDFHMEQAEEAASEAEAEGHRRFRLEGERGVVELKLFEGGAEVLEILGLYRVDSGEHHRLHFLEAVNRLLAGSVYMGDGVAHLHLLGGLYARDDVAHIACGELGAGLHVEFEHPDFVGVVLLSRSHELDEVVLAYSAVDNLEIGYDATEGIEDRVENQGLERSLRVTLRGADTLHYRAEDFGHPYAGLSAGTDDFVGVTAEKVHNLVLYLVGLRAVEVHLVYHRDYLEVIVNRHVEVGDCLGLYALGGVDNEEGPLAGGYRAGDFIGEVDVARSVDEIEHIVLAVEPVVHLDCMALDCDATLAFEVHVVEHLRLEVLGSHGVGIFKQTVGKGALAVVDMGYDTEIADILHTDCKFTTFLPISERLHDKKS